MKPRAHRVCTFSRLFSDFQNSLALRNTTESSLTEGRSCFALRLIGQGTEMSVFFPHLSKAEHVRQTKKYPGNPCFPRFPAPCEAEHRRQPGRSQLAAFDGTGADSVSRLHLSKGRRHSPDVFCCPECGDGGSEMMAAAPPIKKAMPEICVPVTHSCDGRQTDPLIVQKPREERAFKFFLPAVFVLEPPPLRTWRVCQVSHGWRSHSSFPCR